MESIYQPLNSSADCIRLIEVEAAPSLDAPIRCRLVNVDFSQKAQYKALSYTWGNERIKETIYVNGTEFEVGKSLWEALRCLRKNDTSLTLWADALCINQTDLEERNRQLRIMPHIYTRAELVVVWLGRSSQLSCEEQDRSEDNFHTLMALCDHPYWQRVWIIQEIGKARQIHVCFDQNELLWDDFIQQIGGPLRPSWLHEDMQIQCRPLVLDRQLRSKYKGGHTFAALLERHEDAQCREPRDKIYGLVGLAIDSAGFPMNYSKSLFEVWEDTVNFLTSRRLVDKRNIVKFSKLVKTLLGCEKIETKDDTTTKHSFWNFLLPTPKKKAMDIVFDASIIGTIIYKGPSPYQLVADLSATDSWTSTVHQKFKEHRSQATEKNDSFMYLLEQLNESELEVVSPFKMGARWETSECLWSATYGNIALEARSNKSLSNALQFSTHFTSDEFANTKCEAFLYKNRDYPGSGWGIGLGPSQMLVGDLICCVPGLEKAIVVRMTRKDKQDNEEYAEYQLMFIKSIHFFEIVGTALLSVGLKERANHGKLSDFDKLDVRLDTQAMFSLFFT